MNNEIKILLTIVLEGGTLVRKSDEETIKYALTKRDLEPSKKWRGNDGLEVVKKGSFKTRPLIAKPAIMHVSMTMDAYKYMVSAECPYWAKPKVWGIMNAKQRLDAHMKRVCEHHHGKSFTYVVLED